MGQIGSGEAQEHQTSRIAQTVGSQSFSFILFNQHSFTAIRTPRSLCVDKYPGTVHVTLATPKMAFVIEFH